MKRALKLLYIWFTSRTGGLALFASYFGGWALFCVGLSFYAGVGVLYIGAGLFLLAAVGFRTISIMAWLGSYNLEKTKRDDEGAE